MRGKRKILAGLVALALVVLAGCGGSGGGAGAIKIGIIAPLTGPSAEAGTALRQGAELAAQEINAKGGIEVGGKKVDIELIFEDSTSKPEVGVSVAEKLVGRDKVNMLVGEAFHSHVTMAVMELAPKYPEVPFVSWEPISGAIADKVRQDTKKYANFWKGDFNSDGYARTVYNTVKFLVNSKQLVTKNKSVAYVVEDTDYGRSNANDAKKLFEADGWKTATIETVPLGHTDFYPQLNKVKSLNPDVVVTVYTGLASGVAFVKQYQEVGVTATHMAVYYPTRPEFIQQAGKAAEGVLWTPLMFDPANMKHQSAMAEAIQKKYNAKATSDHAYGYDGIYYMADAVKRAGALDGKKISAALGKTEFKGILGRYVFDQEGHFAKDGAEFLPVPAAQIQGGKNLIVWPENVAAAKYQPQPWTK